MKKKIISAALVPFILVTGLLQTSCFGTFPLTRKVYTWNSQVQDKGTLMGRFVNNVVFWAFCVIPVYEVVFMIDGILNLVEFWTGSNPMAMQEGEVEQQHVVHNSKNYLMTATKNELRIQEMDGERVVDDAVLQYCPEDQSWSMVRGGESTMLCKTLEFSDGKVVMDVYALDGKRTITMPTKSI